MIVRASMHRALWVILLVGFGLTSPSLAAGRPNVILLVTDDQRADTIARLGNPAIHTPNLDRLVDRGFVFHNAYCMGSNIPAVCTPSRNMLLCGRSFFRFGAAASPDDPNIVRSLNDAGYLTYHHGKSGNVATRIQSLFAINHYLKDEQARTCGEPGQEIVDGAIEFLRTRQQDKPFFMYLAFACPHDPRVAAKKYLDLYQRDSIPLPKNYAPVHPFDNGEMTVRDEKLAPWPRSEDEICRHLHAYYAVISGLDYHIGRLLDTVRDVGLEDDTYIIFTSDHGLAIGSHGLLGKQNLYEDGMKAPLIVTGPSIHPGQTDALVYLLDLYPTICGFIDAPIPQGLDGENLLPIIRGQSQGVRNTLFTAYRDVQRAIRDSQWKCICYPQINRTQLFDLANDPHELHDLADEPNQQPRIQKLLATMSEWQSRLSDDCPLESATPRDQAFVPPADASSN